MPLSRQQRRQRQRELVRAGEAVIRSGVPAIPRLSDVVGLTLVLLQALSAKPGKSPAAACAELAHRAFEASLRADPPKQALACGRGCAYCCHAAVMLSAPEAFLLARELQKEALGSMATGGDDFLARAALTANQTAAQRLGRKLPCSLLIEQACSMYPFRPLACRRVSSFAVEPCLEEYEGQEGDILVSQKLVTHATNVQLALLAALRASGRPARLYELSAAVGTILQTGNAEARWRAGEDIFAAVAMEEETDPHLASAIARLSSEVGDVLPGKAADAGPWP